MSAILTGADPAGVITLMRAGQYRYASAPSAVTYDGYVWAALDFVCDDTGGPLSPLQLSIAGPLILARQVPGATVDILRISGATLLYSAIGLSPESHEIQSGVFTAVLSHQGFAATQTEMPTYLENLYHGLRRYEDVGMIAYGGTWTPTVARKRNVIPAILSAVRHGLTFKQALSVFRQSKRDSREPQTTPVPDAWPNGSLDNLPKLWSRIPQRYGRSVFAPDIAHPPYWIGSGSTVTRARLFCIGVGAYEIHRIWVGQTLAWQNGASTGNIPGFSATKLGPGADILPSDFDTRKISHLGGPEIQYSGVSVNTRIPIRALSVNARRSSGFGSAELVSIKTVDYFLNGIAVGEQLNTVTGTTTYSTTEVPQNNPGPKYVYEQVADSVYVANMALVPVDAPAVGHSEASHLIIKYTANTSYDTQPITMEATRFVIDPGTGAEMQHSNAAVCAYDVASRAVGSENVDAAAFIALAQSDDVINVACGGVSEQYADAWDLLVSVLRTINAIPVYVGGLLSCVADKPSPAKWLFTPASIARGSISLAEKDRPDSSTTDKQIVEFIDKLSGTKTEAAYTLPGAIGNNEAREILEFVGDSGQALVVARYMLGAARYIKSVVQVGVGLEALTMRIGDRVHIAHPEYGLGDYSGVVDGAITWTETTVTHPSYVLFRRADGGVWGPVLADVEQVAYRGGTVPRIVRVDPTSRAAVDAAQGTLASVIAEYPVLRMEWGAFATAPPRWIVAETQGNSITLVSSAGETAQLY